MIKREYIFLLLILITSLFSISFRNNESTTIYREHYNKRLSDFELKQLQLIKIAEQIDLSKANDNQRIRQEILVTRNSLKEIDFWLRYLEPVSHKKINGPLPVEWETEVFEKFEKPYKREGAGLTLALIYLDEGGISRDTLLNLLRPSVAAAKIYHSDSITRQLTTYHHFYLCNRLFLLNMATIYSSGFECPDPARVIPELQVMLNCMEKTYALFNQTFPATVVTDEYINLYRKAILFAGSQSPDYEKFDHYTFIRDYVNPLFVMNQEMVLKYHVVSKSLVDYSLNKKARSIFSKSLYSGQDPKGIFNHIDDPQELDELDKLGRQLFYDPILSGNNQRSCASCHSPDAFFTNTSTSTSLQFDHEGTLKRNTPSLLNVQYNHLIMQDGKHISLQYQTKAVIGNPIEMGSSEKEMLQKVLSCKNYKSMFRRLLKYTPQEKEITSDHIVSAITFYYSKFSRYESPFDEAMNRGTPTDPNVQKGFNLFMGKAQCATCHFAPQFNGVKPPYVSSEFEVLGVPANISFSELSPDKGRFEVNPAVETLHAFRTGTLRNAALTSPYMHNGVFKTLEEVIDFYNAGGGAGRGLNVPNQTLSSDSLLLTEQDKKYLIDFIRSLNECIQFEGKPDQLPTSSDKNLNLRKAGGTY